MSKLTFFQLIFRYENLMKLCIFPWKWSRLSTKSQIACFFFNQMTDHSIILSWFSFSFDCLSVTVILHACIEFDQFCQKETKIVFSEFKFLFFIPVKENKFFFSFLLFHSFESHRIFYFREEVSCEKTTFWSIFDLPYFLI